jgi:hypothetical protein
VLRRMLTSPCANGSFRQIRAPESNLRCGSKACSVRIMSAGRNRSASSSTHTSHLRNIVRIITETRLRVYKELIAMKKIDVDLANAVVWIPDSKTPNGIAEVPPHPSGG